MEMHLCRGIWLLHPSTSHWNPCRSGRMPQLEQSCPMSSAKPCRKLTRNPKMDRCMVSFIRFLDDWYSLSIRLCYDMFMIPVPCPSFGGCTGYINTSTRLPTKFVLSVFHGERWCSDACATSLPHQNAASTTMSIPVDKHGGMGFHGQVLQSSQILILLLSICFFRVFMSHT